MSAKVSRREVAADLVESTPDSGALSHWVLASPLILFLAWQWVDLFAHYSPIGWYWLNLVLALPLFALIILLPLGVLAHMIVTAAPGLFQKAGWDVQPLEAVAEREQYLVDYKINLRHRAATSWPRLWLRAAQGWVYWEICVILISPLVVLPLFFSAVDFGFGR